MDEGRFDAWTKTITPDVRGRRMLVRLLAGTGAALGFALAGLDVTEAKKRKKRKKRKKKQERLSPPPVNAFGCVDVGAGCQGNSGFCCSGICQGTRPKNGKPDTSACVAHNVGNCTPERNICTVGDPAGASNCGTNAVCTVTTGGAAFCSSTLGVSANNCRICGSDADCEGQGFPPGSACVVLSGVACTGENGCVGVNGSSGTACLPAGAVA